MPRNIGPEKKTRRKTLQAAVTPRPHAHKKLANLLIVTQQAHSHGTEK
jgi:hypothetical protein